MGTKEFFTINGEHLLQKIKELIEEGNVRRITITEKSGKELMSFPLTVGVVGALFARQSRSPARHRTMYRLVVR